MSSSTCPNCGKPLRPGAKFCGNCGATLPGGAAARPASPPPPAASDSTACPHCGKPVRVGARFCAHCGQAIGSGEYPTVVGVSASGEQKSPVGVTQPEAGPPPSPPQGQVNVAAAAPAATVEKMPPATPPKRRGGLAVALILILIAGCVLLLGGGYVLSDRMGWINLGGEPTQTGVVSAEVTTTPTQAEAILTNSPTLTLTAIPVILPTISATAALTITETPVVPTDVGVLTSTLSVAAAPVITSTPAITEGIALEPTLLFEDNFDTALSDNWRAWGDNRPRIDRGPGDRWLYLTAEDPGEAGVTTRTGLQVYNAPGTVVEFEGALDTSYPRSVLLLDWDPEKTVRGPDYREPGLVRIEIRGEQVALITPLTRENCPVTLDSFEKHLYRLQFVQGQGVLLFLDGEPEAVCNIPFLGLAPVPGAVSFSGMGWVTRAKIMQGALP